MHHPRPDSSFPQLLEQLGTETELSLDRLAQLWRNHDLQLWEKHPILFLRAGKKMLSAGEPLLAYDILTEGVDSMGGLVRLEKLAGEPLALLIALLQQQSLALAQSGASEEANTILRSLHENGFSDSETLGILGRTFKDMALTGHDQMKKRAFLREAFACYNTAYKAAYSSGNHETAYYTGINAATVSLLGGYMEQSRETAGQVLQICTTILESKKQQNEPISFWLYASMGEASLLQQNIDKAEEWYSKAAQGSPKDIRALGSMRKQARLILEASGKEAFSLDHCFPVPSVVLFSGHLIDHPSREYQRFPPENEEMIRNRIAKWLDVSKGQIGYSSAACGSDILFLEEMLQRGGEINVILPFEREMFLRTSVDTVPTGRWRERFTHILDKAGEIKVLSQYNEETLDDDLLFTNLYLYGTARVRAERAGTDLRTLLVWDGNGAKTLAGTAALAGLIKEKGGSFAVISPLEGEETTPVYSGENISISDKTGSTTSVMVGHRKACHYSFLPLLIADVKGYSRLNKREKLIFAANFMGEMARVLDTFRDSIMGRKTQGDSLFLVFSDLQACVRSARALKERTAAIDWTEFGLSKQLTLRISLDAGPCYSYTDPITGQPDFCGDYIVRAARLEPVTPPGNIYASETFVAVARALEVEDIRFDYAGQVELPKGYGRIQAFHVR